MTTARRQILLLTLCLLLFRLYGWGQTFTPNDTTIKVAKFDNHYIYQLVLLDERTKDTIKSRTILVRCLHDIDNQITTYERGKTNLALDCNIDYSILIKQDAYKDFEIIQKADRQKCGTFQLGVYYLDPKPGN